MNEQEIQATLDSAIQAREDYEQADTDLGRFEAENPYPYDPAAFPSLADYLRHRKRQEAWDATLTQLQKTKSRAERAAKDIATQLALELQMPTHTRVRIQQPDGSYAVIARNADGDTASVHVQTTPTEGEIDDAYAYDMPF